MAIASLLTLRPSRGGPRLDLGLPPERRRLPACGLVDAGFPHCRQPVHRGPRGFDHWDCRRRNELCDDFRQPFRVVSRATGGFAGFVFALLVRGDLGAPLSCVCVCAVAILAGFLQGYAITIIKNPIITTIAFGAVFVGLAAFEQQRQHSHSRCDGDLDRYRPAAWRSIQSYVFVAWALFATFLLKRTRLGRLITLSGANRLTAAATGFASISRRHLRCPCSRSVARLLPSSPFPSSLRPRPTCSLGWISIASPPSLLEASRCAADRGRRSRPRSARC